MRFCLTVIAALSLLLGFAPFVSAGDESVPSPSSEHTVAKRGVPSAPEAAKGSSTTTAQHSPHPEISLIIYYSKKAEKGPLATPDSRLRLTVILNGLRLAKKSPKEGGLGIAPASGFRNVDEYWDDFVDHLKTPATSLLPGETDEDRQTKAQLDAESLRAFLYRGGTVLVLADAQDKKWCTPCGPISHAVEPIPQFAFLINERERLYGGGHSETKLSENSSTVPPQRNRQEGLVQTVSTTASSGGKR